MALFGKKDFQQLLVIKTMVEDLSLPIDIIGVDTIREPSGLAMSSRNGYLTAQEKIHAAALKQAIDHMAASVQQGMDIETVTQTAKQSLIAVGFTPDYLELRNAHDLKPACDYDKELVIVAAAYLGKARLIDNLTFTR